MLRQLLLVLDLVEPRCADVKRLGWSRVSRERPTDLIGSPLLRSYGIITLLLLWFGTTE